MTRTELAKYIHEVYSADPEFPWLQYPHYEVFRHNGSQKWFALIMDIPKARLGLKGNGIIDIVNLKADPIMVGSLRSESGFFPAYHMNKDSWITVALDGSADDDKIKLLLDRSFDLTRVKSKKRRTAKGEITQ